MPNNPTTRSQGAQPGFVVPLIFTDAMPLYPTAGSLQEVVSLSKSKLPIMDENTLFSLLMTYHNTLLQEIKRGN